MSEQNDIQQDEAEIDRRIIDQTAHALAQTGFGIVFDVQTQAPKGVRGATAELRTVATSLAADTTRGIRVPQTVEYAEKVKIIGKLLNAGGFRAKIAEGMFPVSEGGPLGLFITVYAVERKAA